MSKYVTLIEKTGTGYSAQVPDLPGCVAAAATYSETVCLILEAMEFHIEGMLLKRRAGSGATTAAEMVEVG